MRLTNLGLILTLPALYGQRVKKDTDPLQDTQAVFPLTAGSPFMIPAGITSPDGEMCLQVDRGNFDVTAKIVLDLCETAINANDGRDLWEFNEHDQLVSFNSNPPKCMATTTSQSGSEVTLLDCATALWNDGLSRWKFQPNSQLHTLGSEALCLSQMGALVRGPGSRNLLGSDDATVTCNVSAGEDHLPENVLDDNTETYWASTGYSTPGEHVVEFKLSLGKGGRISAVVIDWEYPALAYDIQVSTDGETFTTVADHKSNGMTQTVDSLNNVLAKYVKIVMNKPHPVWGKHQSSYVYGIRNLRVIAHETVTIVHDCFIASKIGDARDKYIFEAVNIPESSSSKLLASTNKSLNKKVLTIQEEAVKVQELIPKLADCLKEKQDLDPRIGEALEMRERLVQLLDRTQHNHPIFRDLAAIVPGDVSTKSAEDCSDIKEANAESPSGFYWIHPYCSAKPMRVYCEMTEETSIYLAPTNSSMSGLSSTETMDEIQTICANFGLEPLQVNSKDSVNGLINAISLSDYNDVIPIGYDRSCSRGSCSGIHTDLLNGVVKVPISGPASTTNLQGKSFLGIKGKSGSMIGFEIESVILGKVACSTNNSKKTPKTVYAAVECDAIFEANPIFVGVNNTNVVVKCPDDCEIVNEENLVGNGNVYSAKTPVCQAAVQQNLHRGLINVSLESSASLPDVETSRSYRVGPVFTDCPISIKVAQDSDEGLTKELDDYIVRTAEMDLDAKATVEARALASTHKSVNRLIDESRHILRSAELYQKRQATSVPELYTLSRGLNESVQETSSAFYDTLLELDNEVTSLNEAHELASGFTSFKPETGKPFEYNWMTFDSPQTLRGPGEWVTSVSEDNGFVLSQASPVAGYQNWQGTYAILKRHSFYDMAFNVAVKIGKEGTVGILFRFLNAENYYAFVIDQGVGLARVEIVSSGDQSILAETSGRLSVEDWSEITVSVVQGSIEAEIDGKHILSIHDETLSSGSVGFLSSGAITGVQFKDIEVNAKHCKNPKKTNPPPPPQCSYFVEDYSKTFFSVYDQVDPQENTGDNVVWEVRPHVGGRYRTLYAVGSVENSAEIGSQAIVKGPRTCKDGFVSVDFLTHCPQAVIGVIYRYTDSDKYEIVEVTRTEFRIRNVTNGSPTTITRKHKGFIPDEWASISVTFDGPSVTVTLDTEGISTLWSEDIAGSSSRDGRIGLSTYGCKSVAFDRLRFSPGSNEKESQKVAVETDGGEWADCANTVHLLDRQRMCLDMLHDQPSFRQKTCTYDFCNECCAWHTGMLNHEESEKCRHSCSQNDAHSLQGVEQFTSLLTECAKESSDVLNHCAKSDQTCKFDMCQMCCKTSEIGGSDTAMMACARQCQLAFREL